VAYEMLAQDLKHKASCYRWGRLVSFTSFTMKTRWSIILGILFLLAPGLSAENSVKQPDHRKKIVLDESENGKRIEVKVGDEIQIELNGLGATGYAWYFEILDRHLFQMSGEERRAKKSENGEFVGSPIRHIWVLKAMEAGSTIIGMSYYRIWEGTDKALRRFEIGVDIIP
jgi:inhibitor of cysteine peptidase